ncbi:GAD-like domain-containing protein [Xanthomonas sp. 3075]|uniref:GAD-like domain-containing protein n=1 Tax=Xanthomonas sp. 3075 TaxID=3035315 RepID=UPI00160B3C3E|nr:GAD-like domain-containing protein [Xanthomonas sp. 3075]
MSWFRRLALSPFIKAHPPRKTQPAPADLLATYETVLPASLLELWRKQGLGHYGSVQLALIDPRQWQPVLDRWIVSPPDAARRIPIALTPFGALVYYRKLTATDEDVVYLDPVSKAAADLSWSLDDFFNQYVCDAASCDSLIPSALLAAAHTECGPLAAGEVYEIDQMLFSMQMLRINKVDALALHTRLRDAVDGPASVAATPTTNGDALPAAQRSTFEGLFNQRQNTNDLHGLYLSSYIDWHRMLALEPDGQYRLLFWKIDHRSLARTDVRAYSGRYEVARSELGDEHVTLDIRLRRDSSGSDANDAQLVVMRSGTDMFLLRTDELADMATAMDGATTLGRSEYYFRKVTLADAFVEEPSAGRAAPPLADLPQALQQLVNANAIIATITHVDEADPDAEDDGAGTVMCRLDRGRDDGLRMNMPLRSPPGTGRALYGWVWEMDPAACRAGIKYQRGSDGEMEHGPVVGDVLTSRLSGE